MRVLEVFMVDVSMAAHQMGRAERLAPRVVVRVARGDLKVVVRGKGVDLDAVLDEQSGRPEVQRRLIRVALPAQAHGLLDHAVTISAIDRRDQFARKRDPPQINKGPPRGRRVASS